MDESQSFYVRVDHRDIEGIEAPTRGFDPSGGQSHQAGLNMLAEHIAAQEKVYPLSSREL